MTIPIGNGCYIEFLTYPASEPACGMVVEWPWIFFFLFFAPFFTFYWVTRGDY